MKKTVVGNAVASHQKLKHVLVATALSLSALTAPTFGNDIQKFEVKSRLIDHFKIGSDETQFGQLQFVGGLEMIGTSRDFGAISAIDVQDNQRDFVAVADTGFWLTGSIERDGAGKPSGIVVQMSEMAGKSGMPISQKWQADAEGLIVSGDKTIVSFERAHRIDTYSANPEGTFDLQNTMLPPVPLYELRDNRGFEGIAMAPLDSPLAGALVGVSEKSLDINKNLMSFVTMPDGQSFEFSVKRTDEFDATDIAFLPNGNLILLERRFNFTDGVAMRLRLLRAAEIQPQATIDGPILLVADMQYQIDNMEGLDITVDSDGSPRLTIVSDDNHSLLQRNLLLEFRLTGNLN